MPIQSNTFGCHTIVGRISFCCSESQLVECWNGWIKLWSLEDVRAKNVPMNRPLLSLEIRCDKKENPMRGFRTGTPSVMARLHLRPRGLKMEPTIQTSVMAVTAPVENSTTGLCAVMRGFSASMNNESKVCTHVDRDLTSVDQRFDPERIQTRDERLEFYCSVCGLIHTAGWPCWPSFVDSYLHKQVLRHLWWDVQHRW